MPSTGPGWRRRGHTRGQCPCVNVPQTRWPCRKPPQHVEMATVTFLSASHDFPRTIPRLVEQLGHNFFAFLEQNVSGFPGKHERQNVSFMRNWLMRPWKPGSPEIRHLRPGDPGKLARLSALSAEARELREPWSEPQSEGKRRRGHSGTQWTGGRGGHLQVSVHPFKCLAHPETRSQTLLKRAVWAPLSPAQ